jgi:hypothetical protein
MDLDKKMPSWTLMVGRTLAIIYLFTMAYGTVSNETLMLIAVLFLSTEMQIDQFRAVFSSQRQAHTALEVGKVRLDALERRESAGRRLEDRENGPTNKSSHF